MYVNELDVWTGTLSPLKAFIYYKVDQLPCFKKENPSQCVVRLQQTGCLAGLL